MEHYNKVLKEAQKESNFNYLIPGSQEDEAVPCAVQLRPEPVHGRDHGRHGLLGPQGPPLLGQPAEHEDPEGGQEAKDSLNRFVTALFVPAEFVTDSIVTADYNDSYCNIVTYWSVTARIIQGLRRNTFSTLNTPVILS